MKINTTVLGNHMVDQKYIITYRYWIDGDCQCSAVKIKREFYKYPTDQELVEAV